MLVLVLLGLLLVPLVLALPVALFVEVFGRFELPGRDDAVRWSIAETNREWIDGCGEVADARVVQVIRRPVEGSDLGVFSQMREPREQPRSELYEIHLEADTPCGPRRFAYTVHTSIVMLGIRFRQTTLRECDHCRIARRRPWASPTGSHELK